MRTRARSTIQPPKRTRPRRPAEKEHAEVGSSSSGEPDDTTISVLRKKRKETPDAIPTDSDTAITSSTRARRHTCAEVRPRPSSRK